MARYDDGAYGKIVTEGDVHTVNQQAAGIASRAEAKTFIYSYLYGAGDEKLGINCGGVTPADIAKYKAERRDCGPRSSADPPQAGRQRPEDQGH
jgi:ribonuclease BN (tRNA processing enzyme)